MLLKPTQLSRVIAASRSYRGTSQSDWLSDQTPDGGPRITRIAARIQDAEERGYAFEILGPRHKTRVYRLISEPDVERAIGDPPDRPSQAITRSSGRGAATDMAPLPSAGSRKAPVVEDDAGLITRASADGSLSAEPETLFTIEPRTVGHYEEDAAA